jgi:hypothetical protein
MNWNFCKAMESTPPKSWVGSGSLTDGSMCSCIYIYVYIYVYVYIYMCIYICDTGPSGYCIYNYSITRHIPLSKRVISHWKSLHPSRAQLLPTLIAGD